MSGSLNWRRSVGQLALDQPASSSPQVFADCVLADLLRAAQMGRVDRAVAICSSSHSRSRMRQRGGVTGRRAWRPASTLSYALLTARTPGAARQRLACPATPASEFAHALGDGLRKNR